MAVLDILEFFDESGEVMIVKMPQEGSGEFRTGTQLVVQESQVAVFYRDGKALDGFKPGRHTLSTRNLPLLGKLIGLPFGKSPFRAYVYFIATKTFTNLGWGTPNPIPLRDTDFGYVNVRGHGSYAIRITKPRTFLNTIVGTRGKETTYALEEYLRSMIVSRLTQALAAKMNGKSLFDLPVVYNEIAADCKDLVRTDFDQYGIELVDLLVEAITPPPEVQEAINQRAGMQVQNMERLKTIRQLDALNTAAGNEGQAGGAMGTGMGLGMGMAMANQFSGMMNNMGQHAAGQNPAAPGGAAGGPPPLPQAVQFYAVVAGAQAGPFDPAGLQGQIQGGQITRESLVWRTGMANWQPAGEVPEVAALFNAPPPPPPPPPPPTTPPPPPTTTM